MSIERMDHVGLVVAALPTEHHRGHDFAMEIRATQTEGGCLSCCTVTTRSRPVLVIRRTLHQPAPGVRK